jgi:predicted HicB family RNase H-like nuclease
MNENNIKTSLTAPRKLWRKLKVIAGDKGVSVNTLVIEALQKQYGCIEVKL